MLISGRCHCGNISFALDWRPEPSEIPARACTCSFCAKHGGVWTSCPTGSLTRFRHQNCRVSCLYRVWRGTRGHQPNRWPPVCGRQRQPYFDTRPRSLTLTLSCSDARHQASRARINKAASAGASATGLPMSGLKPPVRHLASDFPPPPRFVCQPPGLSVMM
jgi:hypothetical protein